ncbi:LytTR family DNA-binding domain-containing protein [soil metagenome]
MIRTLIIDDEQHCIDRVTNLLEAHKDKVHLMDALQSVEEGVTAIRKFKPDLIFLDVQINDKTGFDLLKQIDTHDFEVIFTTAHDKYAVQAFKFSAIDYLLKPVDADDLQQALEKVSKKVAEKTNNDRLDILLHNLKSTHGTTKKISIPTVNGFVFVQVTDILRCQSEINYTTIFLKDKQKITVAKTLKEFEELLTEYNFFRVHNSHLINLAYIKSYNKGKGGIVTMMDQTDIEVSTRRKDDLMKKLGEI